MTIQCIGKDCGAAYVQGYPGPIFDDNLEAAGWEHTPFGWLCPDCSAPPVDPPGLCPVCGVLVTLTGETTDGRLIGSCGDAFFRQKWEEA